MKCTVGSGGRQWWSAVVVGSGGRQWWSAVVVGSGGRQWWSPLAPTAVFVHKPVIDTQNDCGYAC
jgi:hypothetical protein